MVDEHRKHAKVSQYLNIKMTIKVISIDSMENKHSQRYPQNLNLRKKYEDVIAFLSETFYFGSYQRVPEFICSRNKYGKCLK